MLPKPLDLEECVANLETAGRAIALPGDPTLGAMATLARGAVEQEVSAGRCTREEAQTYLSRIAAAAPTAKQSWPLFTLSDVDRLMAYLDSLSHRDDEDAKDERYAVGAMIQTVINRELRAGDMSAHAHEEMVSKVRSLMPPMAKGA